MPYNPRVLRLVLSFVVAVVLLQVLRGVPYIGGLFHGFFGFWLFLILFTAVLNRLSDVLFERAKLARAIRALGAVDKPHNQGKLGTLLVVHGRPRRALPHLEAAVAGEPEVAEWHYRHGQTLLALGQRDAGIAALERAAAIDPEHAYGSVQLALARAYEVKRDGLRVLAALDTFDRNHGPNPESAFRRAVVLERAGLSEESKRALRAVSELAQQAAKFQRKSNRWWVARAWLARLF